MNPKNILRFAFQRLAPMPSDPFVQHLRKTLGSSVNLSEPHVRSKNSVFAVQGVEDPLFFGLFAALAMDLKAATKCRAALVQVPSINRGMGIDWRAKLQRSWMFSALANRQWANANFQLVGPVAYRSTSLSNPFGDLADWVRAKNLWRSLQGKSDISTLEIDDIVIGDLVIDSFLRFRPSPRFDVSDAFVRRVLWQCFRDIRRAKQWFDKVRPRLYISSYSTYVEHGVAVRVALSLGLAVFVYGNPIVFGKRLSKSYPFHTPDTSSYREVFETLPLQVERLDQAEQHLALRLSGGIDKATFYMKSSAYASSDEVVPNVCGSVVVFMHDFYDSPHAYPDLVFPDFWAWIDCTIRTLRDACIPFWIKPHPNQIDLSSEVFKRLHDTHSDIRILSTRISNNQLVEAGIICGVTVYGTVAHELAYLGVPSITCARHPHYKFDFCRTAKCVTDYVAMLRTPDDCLLSKAEMKRQSLIFYYMHNLYGSNATLELRDRVARFYKAADTEGVSPEELGKQLEKLRGLPGWRSHLETLINEISAHREVATRPSLFN